MDETGKTNQDAPQAVGQPSGGEAGTTPSNPRTYTEADVQKLISDTKAEAGRKLKTLETEAKAFKTQAETLETQLTSTTSRLKAIEEKIASAELEGAKSSPEALDLYQQRQALKKQQEEIEAGQQALAKERAQHASDLEEVQAYRRQTLINETAAKFGVNAKLLDKPYITSQEQLEDLAKTLQTVKVPAAQGAPGNIQPDSGMTTGGSVDLSNMSASDLIKRGLEKRNK